MDLFETLGEALRPEMIKSEKSGVPFPKKPYFNIWVHVEAVTFDEDGEEVFTDMDETYMPIKLVELDSESEVDRIMRQLEEEEYMFY